MLPPLRLRRAPCPSPSMVFACSSTSRRRGSFPAGPTMREKPTLLLYGGPGFDHAAFTPCCSGLSDIAQMVDGDHRGRGEDGDCADWMLTQRGDDIKGPCDALGLVRPIMLGMPWGGTIAQAYATRHLDHPGKLVLASTAAKIGRIPGRPHRRDRLGRGPPPTGARSTSAPASHSRRTRPPCRPTASASSVSRKSGHGLFGDDLERVLSALREFITVA